MTLIRASNLEAIHQVWLLGDCDSTAKFREPVVQSFLGGMAKSYVKRSTEKYHE